MFFRPIIVATAMAVFTTLPFNAANAQVNQQQQQQQQRGALATVTLPEITLSSDNVIADTNAMVAAPEAKAKVTLTQATKELCYEISFASATEDSVTAAIHRAPKGQAGPSVLSLNVRKDTTMTKQCVTVDPFVYDQLVADPTNFYIQVSNPKWRKGAIRGQLAKPNGFR